LSKGLLQKPDYVRQTAEAAVHIDSLEGKAGS
jgi:hypothetical protein